MRFITAEDIEKFVSPRDLVEALRDGFEQGCEAPLRSHFNMERSNEDDATFLIMPAWQKDGAGRCENRRRRSGQFGTQSSGCFRHLCFA